MELRVQEEGKTDLTSAGGDTRQTSFACMGPLPYLPGKFEYSTMDQG